MAICTSPINGTTASARCRARATISTIAGKARRPATPTAWRPRAPLGRPEGLLADPGGVLWIAEYFGNSRAQADARRDHPHGGGQRDKPFQRRFPSSHVAQLQAPGQIALDRRETCTSADSGNHRIRKVTAGTISTYAGTGSAGFSGDGGQASSAQLSLPRGIAFDSAGNLYIADTGNNRVRQSDPGAANQHGRRKRAPFRELPRYKRLPALSNAIPAREDSVGG